MLTKNPTADSEKVLPVSTNPSLGADAQNAFSATTTVVSEPLCDIEHVPVKNDPRAWSNLRKNGSLVLIAFASMIAALAANIQNPAVEEMEADLPATSSQFSLSISIFILIQGVMPLMWSTVSEVKGRKMVYIVSIGLYTLASIIVALSHSITLVIGFRALQAAGSSAVMAIGAASLADIFEPEERGQKMGVYYVAPLLGPALGPIFGGIVTSVWGWRAIFWFLTIDSGVVLVAFVFLFQDTFRRERSLTYQTVLKERLQNQALTPVPKSKISKIGMGCLRGNKSDIFDLEKSISKQDTAITLTPVKLSIIDVNPFKPMLLVLRRKNNFLVLLCSGLLFSYSFLVPYATSRTLASAYHYGPLKIGLVTLAYGAGAMFGSILGGRWSDRGLARLKAANGGHGYPEMRLKSTTFGIFFLPPCLIGYGWLCQKTVHVSALCVFLFLGGFFSIWIYSIMLAYVVDANPGRSSTAVAANSAFRGIAAFVATEIAVPIQDGLGDGWLYTIWGVLMVFTGACMIVMQWKGAQWREEAEAREKGLGSRSTTIASVGVKSSIPS